MAKPAARPHVAALSARDLTLARDGAALRPGAVRDRMAELRAGFAHLPATRAGTRLHGIDWLRPLLAAGGAIGRHAAAVLGPHARPVRAILFDKSIAANWSLGWHQDRTICVARPVPTPGYGPWTVKQGLNHVAPPAELLAGMITVRVHLDDVPADNAPLLVAPGSHQFGYVAEQQVDAVVQRCGVASCLAEAGDLWLYATLILHGSQSSTAPTRRRVLQVDFAACDLPGELTWLGL